MPLQQRNGVVFLTRSKQKIIFEDADNSWTRVSNIILDLIEPRVSIPIMNILPQILLSDMFYVNWTAIILVYFYFE